MPADPLQPLRDALAFSPDNLPLRRHLADSLMTAGRFEEAEAESRELLRRSPDAVDAKLMLAKAFAQQAKESQAIVLLETLTRGDQAVPAARVMLARLLFKTGKVDEAVRQYRRAVEADASVADADLDATFAEGTTRDEVVDGRVRTAVDGGDGDAPSEIERPKLTFADVGGLEALKEDVRMKIIHPLAHAEMYAAYGKKIGGGILMYGPPGCGKTYLARATAGEIRAGFVSVGINDVLDMWLGNSERNLHALFERARRNKPCVMFFDEVDALAASRADMRTSSGRHLINQFLSEMDGVAGDNDGVLILAATNAPWSVDGAFRRPGRFDRILFVPPPDAPARAAILRAHLRGKPQADVDASAIAARCEDFSGADLAAVVDVAVEAKLREAMRTGVPQPIVTGDLARAAATVKPSTREWFASARNYALYANQGGQYDEIVKYLKM